MIIIFQSKNLQKKIIWKKVEFFFDKIIINVLMFLYQLNKVEAPSYDDFLDSFILKIQICKGR